MIFDCDGVLVDSERISVRIDVRVLAELGWPLTEAEVIERFVGRSEEYMIGEIEAALGRRLAAGLGGAVPPPLPRRLRGRARARRRRRRRARRDRGADVRGVEQQPRAAAPHARPHRACSIASTAASSAPRTSRNGKPAPDLFLHAATTLGADPARCAVVEDSRHGVEAARAAGMRAFAYAGGVTPADRLAGPGTIVFGDMRELPGSARVRRDELRH